MSDHAAPAAQRNIDYLEAARANWERVPGFDHDPMQFVAAMQACALVDIAESLRVISGRNIPPMLDIAARVRDAELADIAVGDFDEPPAGTEPF